MIKQCVYVCAIFSSKQMVVDFVLFKLQITQSNAQIQSKGSHMIGFHECQCKKFLGILHFPSERRYIYSTKELINQKTQIMTSMKLK